MSHTLMTVRSTVICPYLCQMVALTIDSWSYIPQVISADGTNAISCIISMNLSSLVALLRCIEGILVVLSDVVRRGNFFGLELVVHIIYNVICLYDDA
jgi:hypothetical protein